jgi:hypothetical protein
MKKLKNGKRKEPSADQLYLNDISTIYQPYINDIGGLWLALN